MPNTAIGGNGVSPAESSSSSSALVVQVLKPDVDVVPIRLVGTSPLICHRWSEKAKKQMLDKQTKRAQTAREVKDPERDYRESLYPHPEGGYGFPSLAFKNAAVTAVSQVSGLTKVFTRGAFHVLGELVKIEGEPRMRQDMVRVGMGTADIRYRGEFPEWACTVTVRYNRRVISEEQLFNLFEQAGFSVGIGEWRPEKDGNYGMFTVEG